MKTKNNDRKQLLLQLLEEVNSEEEFEFIQSELALLASHHNHAQEVRQ